MSGTRFTRSTFRPFWAVRAEGLGTRETLEIDYVDNCWLRVPVRRAKLIAFFKELYGQEAEFPLAIVAALPDEWEFALVAEEF